MRFLPLFRGAGGSYEAGREVTLDAAPGATAGVQSGLPLRCDAPHVAHTNTACGVLSQQSSVFDPAAIWLPEGETSKRHNNKKII